jgi:predicted PurR-regulated permease PerM
MTPRLRSDPRTTLATGERHPVAREQPTVRAILRVVLTVVLSALALVVLYLVREPLGWVVMAMFVANAASGPVNFLSRHIPRTAAVGIVYIGIVLIPIGIALILVPPVVEQAVRLVDNLPRYVQDLDDAFKKNPQLQELNEKYDITTKLEDLARDLVSELDDAAAALADIGAGVVSTIFALVTILVMSMFMVGRGARWRDALLAYRPAHQAESSAGPPTASPPRSGATSRVRSSRHSSRGRPHG